MATGYSLPWLLCIEMAYACCISDSSPFVYSTRSSNSIVIPELSAAMALMIPVSPL